LGRQTTLLPLFGSPAALTIDVCFYLKATELSRRSEMTLNATKPNRLRKAGPKT
jgi:hypothetical protein